ncbi:PLP-dependent aminotransferase family protein [Paenarthrobacter sp. NPDC056912]|uniref:aminotransferase-like domain-containing protein n=1 Tax=Paenarthrobacter sp. NPDC056912 TaxID=3345965 RepID=UPI0036715602
MIESVRTRILEPTARGLADAVSQSIRDGSLESGSKLPPIRSVAATLSLSPSTVSNAWSQLAKAGLIFTDGARGTFVAASAAPPARYRRALQYSGKFEIDLSTGLPDAELLPDIQSAFSRFVGSSHSDSYLGDTLLPDLGRELRKSWARGIEAITITDGGMDALDLLIASRVRLGDFVAVEDPGYPPLFDLLGAAGARMLSVEVDNDGLVPASLEKALKSGASVVFLQTRAQNPTGAVLTAARAKQLSDVMGRYDTLIVEFDFADGISAAPWVSFTQLLPERTCHIHGYSSSLGPEMRLAALGGPSAVIDPIVQRRHLGQGWTSRILQSLLLDLITDESSLTQVENACAEYAARRSALVAELAQLGVEVGGSDGINVWIPVANEAAALLSLATEGIGVAPGSPYILNSPVSHHICVTAGLVPVGESRRIAAAISRAAKPSSASRSA